MKYRESDESPGTGVYEISIRIHYSLEFIIGRALGCLRAYNIKKKKKIVQNISKVRPLQRPHHLVRRRTVADELNIGKDRGVRTPPQF